MRTGRGRVEHLHEVAGGARRGERLEHGFEHPRPTEPPEALPDRVPIAELGRQCPPRDVMNGEIMKRFQKLAVVARPAPCRPAAAAPPGTPSGPRPNLPRSSVSASPAPSDRADACLNMVNKFLIPSTRPSDVCDHMGAT